MTSVADPGDIWTIQRLLEWTSGHFTSRGIDNPRLDAELLLSHALGVDRIYLYTHHDKPIGPDERERFRDYVRRRAGRQPVSQILGCREFYGRVFEVTAEVLTPRPETEHLVDVVLAWAKGRSVRRVLDVGTGTGAIAATLALELPEVEVLATDLSPAALEVAARNLATLGVSDRVRLLQGSLFEPVAGQLFDVVVSNPPYLGNSERDALQPEVRDHEPGLALFAGDDGLEVLRALCQQSRGFLSPEGLLAMEMGWSQRDSVGALLKEAGFEHIAFEKDLQGHFRVAVAQSHRAASESIDSPVSEVL